MKVIQTTNGLKRKFTLNNNLILSMLLIIIFIVFSFLNKGFLTYYNISTLFRNLVVVGILAIGLTPLMISGGLDISFGSNLSLATVVLAILFNSGVNIYLSMLIIVLLSTSIAFVNGLLIEFFNLNPLIATLGAMSIYQAVAFIFSKNVPIGIVSDKLFNLAFGFFLKLPIILWFLILMVLIYYFVLKYTIFGRYVYIIGANPHAAYSIGIKVKKIRVVLYASLGMIVGFAGIFTTAIIGTGSPWHGVSLLFPPLSAVLLGGISLMGGSGNIWGSLLGIMIISIFLNGMSVLGISYDKFQIIQGILLIVIVAIYQARSKKIS